MFLLYGRGRCQCPACECGAYLEPDFSSSVCYVLLALNLRTSDFASRFRGTLQTSAFAAMLGGNTGAMHRRMTSLVGAEGMSSNIVEVFIPYVFLQI